VKKVIGNAKKDVLLGKFRQQADEMRATGAFFDRVQSHTYWVALENALKDRGDIPKDADDVANEGSKSILGWQGPDYQELYFTDGQDVDQQADDGVAQLLALLGAGNERDVNDVGAAFG
jgi:hypothetical protein